MSLAFFPHLAKAQDIVPLSVISNYKGCPATLKMDQLKSILKGEKQRWTDGTKVVIALMKATTPVGLNTCSKIYKMTNNEIQKHFLALVFQGKGEAPVFFSSIAELQSFINQTPGAIGVIATNPAETEKIILIDGKKTI